MNVKAAYLLPAAIFLAALVFLALWMFAPVAEAAGGPPSEFRGVAFGTPLEEIEGLTHVPAQGPNASRFKDVYYREDEQLNMGGAVLKSVAYYFHEGVLRSVVVVIQGDVDAFMVKDQLIAKYGPGRQIGGRYGWTWPEFSLVMDRAPDRAVNTLTYTWEPAAPEKSE